MMLNSASTPQGAVRMAQFQSRSLTRREFAAITTPMFGLWVASIVLFFILVRAGSAMLVVGQVTPAPSPYAATTTASELVRLYVTTAGSFLVALGLTLVVHEGLHGLAYLLCGYRPRLKGGRFVYDFPTGSDTPLTRSQLVVVHLTPLVILSLVLLPLFGLPSVQFFALFAIALNIAGSLDDGWVAFRVWQSPHFFQS